MQFLNIHTVFVSFLKKYWIGVILFYFLNKQHWLFQPCKQLFFHIFSSLYTSAFCSCIIAKCSLKHCSTFNLWGKWLLFDIFNSELKNPQVFFYLDVWGHKNDFMLDWSNTKRNCCIRAGNIFGHWNAAYLSVCFMYFHTF